MNKHFKNFLRGKKGESAFEVAETSIFYIVILPIIALIVIAFVFFLNSYANKLAAVPDEIKAEIISLRFTNIPECFAYQDLETGRVYSGTIDLEKFNEEQMNECYFTDEDIGHEDFNFRLQLASRAPEFIKTNGYFNLDHFTLNKKVIVKDGDKFVVDTLLIFVQARPKL